MPPNPPLLPSHSTAPRVDDSHHGKSTPCRGPEGVTTLGPESCGAFLHVQSSAAAKLAAPKLRRAARSVRMAVRFMGVSFRGGGQVALRADAGSSLSSSGINGGEGLSDEVAAWCPSFRRRFV